MSTLIAKFKGCLYVLLSKKLYNQTGVDFKLHCFLCDEKKRPYYLSMSHYLVKVINLLTKAVSHFLFDKCDINLHK